MFTLAEYDFKTNIHLFQYKDLKILLDVNSGAIHLLDDITAKLIEYLAEYQGDLYRAAESCSQYFPAQQVNEAVEEIIAAFEEGAIFSPPDDLVIDLARMSVKALCLNIAHACNMKCKYCFASQGDFGLNPSLMSLEVGKKALDFLAAKSEGITNLEIDFFGGEPLLNVEVVKKLVAYGRDLEKQTGKHFNFTLTTNSLLLDEPTMDFIIENQISVILSLDGRPATNDRYRVLNDGRGSYDLIIPRIREMVARHPVSYYIRGTFTRKNLDFVNDLRHIIDSGFNCLSLEPAVGPDSEFSVREEDLPQVLDQYEKLTDALLEYHQAGKDIHFFHYNLDLQKGPCLAKRLSGCGAGVEYLVITPQGDIYPCHQFVGQPEFYMGNVLTGDIDRKISTRFMHNVLPNKEECRQCWARFFCGGGCHANNFNRNKDMAKPDKISCTMHKKRIEGAIYLDIKKMLDRD